MSTANLTPEQQNLLSLIQLFESTGGSEGYLRHLEASRSATENAPQFDKNKEGLIYSEVDITIVANKPAKDHFTIDVRTKGGKGYGWAPGAIDKTFSGALTLPNWDTVLKAGDIPFKGVKPDVGIKDLIDWEAYIDDKPFVSFGGVAPGEGALEGKGGIMSWRKVLPYPGEQ
ncbi:hypothetical protein FRC01_005661 [Tulasnella sp. 417]|nr:hypothetical protein FRC01_005661 [Tulasnella sp. 417]